MDVKSIQEHMCKEKLKNMVDSAQNFNEEMKYQLKAIIDTSPSPEDLLQTVLLYFSALKWS